MDVGRRDELTAWARELERSDDSDLRAAGRAIRILCEENATLAQELGQQQRVVGGSGAPASGGRRRGGELDRSPPEGPARTRRRRPFQLARVRVRLLAVAVAAFVALAVAGFVAVTAASPELQLAGPGGGEVVGARGLASLVFASPQQDSRWTLDGRSINPVRQGNELVFRPRALSDGEHTLVVRRDVGLLRSARRSLHFVVDTAAPVLRLDAPAVVESGKRLTLTGALEPRATLVVEGRPVAVGADGRFAFTPAPRRMRLLVVAQDTAGNTSRWRVPVSVVPRVPREPIRAVHVSAYGWADSTLRAGVLELIRAHRINTVELDLKDEGGEVGWDAPVPYARQIGANRRIFDLPEAVAKLHARGVRVIGRLVCFRDPIQAGAAWRAGRRTEVVQTPGGGAYSGYGGFTNPANPVVRKYNIDLAVAAAGAGVDEILYDYVRRPDGPISSMVFPGLRTSPERVIADFLAESRRALAASGAFLGASVFGVAATRPGEVAQDIHAMARSVDYVAPMVYPSHWRSGEYDVASPNTSPYEIVRRSLPDFLRQVRGTGARVVPWLQDFSLGYTYGAAEVAAQIRGARDAGIREFILWDPAVTYTAEALVQTAKVPALGLGSASRQGAPGPVRLLDAEPARKPAAQGRRSGLPPNELGQVAVLMHHRIVASDAGDFDQTPADFRAELEALWRRGFVPITVGELLDGRIDLPKGASPVVMTFDDASREQFALGPAGRPLRGTAIEIMLSFARTHPGFRATGTFYVNRDPFGVQDGAPLLRWLVNHGFELGDHTRDHLALRDLNATEVQKQIALGAALIDAAVPRNRIRSLALPFGSMPRDERLAVSGSWGDRHYGPFAVLLVGSNPAPSPFSRAFEPTAIPRIRTSHLPLTRPDEFGFAYWLAELDRNPGSRYVSDGNPRAVTAPAAAESDLDQRYRARFRPLDR